MKLINFHIAHISAFSPRGIQDESMTLHDDATIVGIQWAQGATNHHILIVTETPLEESASEWRSDDPT